MEFNITPIESRDELESLLIECFLEMDTTYVVETEDSVQVDYPYASTYFEDGERSALKCTIDLVTAGFALINDYTIHKEYAANWSMAEFSIKKQYRRMGFGKKFVKRIFEQYPGKWEIKADAENTAAIDFWRHLKSVSEIVTGQEIHLTGESRTSILFLFEV